MSNPPKFDYTPEQVNGLFEASTRELEAKIKTIVDVPGPQRDFKNTVLAFERASSAFGEAVRLPCLLAYVSSDAALRKAGQELELKVGQYSVDLMTREDIFNALNEYAAKGERLDPVDARLLEKTLLDFKQNGLGLPPRRKNLVKKLMKQLVAIELDYQKNLRDVNDALEMTADELKGLPEDYKARLKRTGKGGWLVTMNYPDYVPFMQLAEDANARRRLEGMFNNRCSAVNIKLMEDAIALRRKIGKLLGFASYADYVLDDRMAKNSANVFAFLERTQARLKRKARRELRERLKLKGTQDKTLNAWETGFYNNLLKKTKYSIDHEKIRKYFPLETVLKGMFEVFGEVFRASFVPARLPVWHPDVRAYEVKDADGSVAAYFYLDLFPREGKYKHAACFGVRKGCERPDGSYEVPAAGIVSNFTPPSGSVPPLLKFDEVVTLFHEFGHVTHNIFTRAKYARFSGTSVSRDFVEVPSKMLENWAYDPAVLRRISGHWQRPGEKLPDATIKKLIDAKNMDSGLGNLRQIFFSLLDMRYHTARGKVDTTKLYDKLMKKISLIPMSPGTHPQASFGHLMGGYEAGYYSYLWSEVIAADLFGAFADSGVMNPETGAKYRELILAPGRSYDEAGQVEKFLGRPAGEEAFLKSIGAD